MTSTLRRAEPAPYPSTTTAHPACQGTDTEIFFPIGPAASSARAKAFCRVCHIRAACLKYALAYDVHGVWGGTTRPERNRIRRQLGIHPLPITEMPR